MRENFTELELCEKIVSMLKARGYCPEFDTEDLWVTCLVNGIKFAAHTPEDTLFGYSCEFNFGRKLSDEEKESIVRIFDEQEPVIFENLHFSEDGVLITTILPTEFFDEEFIEEVISSFHQKNALLEHLKTNSMTWEDN
jgi:hypothetical protein